MLQDKASGDDPSLELETELGLLVDLFLGLREVGVCCTNVVEKTAQIVCFTPVGEVPRWKVVLDESGAWWQTRLDYKEVAAIPNMTTHRKHRP